MQHVLAGLAIAGSFALGVATTPSAPHATHVLTFQDPAIVEASDLVVGGIAVVYAFGIPVLVWRTDSTALAGLAFVPGDLIKAALATAVTVGVHRALPQR